MLIDCCCYNFNYHVFIKTAYQVLHLIDFLKVLCFPFPVPVVRPSTKIPLSRSLSAREKLGGRFVGESSALWSQRGERCILRESRDERRRKNKAHVTSPLFWLFPRSLLERHAPVWLIYDALFWPDSGMFVRNKMAFTQSCLFKFIWIEVGGILDV